MFVKEIKDARMYNYPYYYLGNKYLICHKIIKKSLVDKISKNTVEYFSKTL